MGCVGRGNTSESWRLGNRRIIGFTAGSESFLGSSGMVSKGFGFGFGTGLGLKKKM